MSGMVSKGQIPTQSRGALPADLRLAITNFKNDLREGNNIRRFWNGKPDERGRRHEGASPLPRLSDGCQYLEYDVGAGRWNRGNRRIVAEVVMPRDEEATTKRQIREIYFTDDHYTKGSFVRLL